MAVEEVGAGANGINWVEARWSLARHLVHPVIMSCKSGFRAPTKLLTCCSFAQKLNCCWQAAGGGQLGGCWAWWCLPVFGVGACVRGWVRRRAAGAAMAAAIAVAVALAATAAAMRHACLSGSDSGNGRRRREGGHGGG